MRGDRMNYRKLICAIFVLVVLATTAAGAQEIVTFTVTWNPISDPGVSEVLIYRAETDQIGDYVMVGTASASGSEFVDDSALERGVKYYYRLRSRNAYGQVSGFSTVVTAMVIDPESPEEIKSECRINSVTNTSGSDWEVDWSTVIPATGVLEYWKMGSSEVFSADASDILATTHTTMLTGLDDESIYFIHAVSYCEAEENMVISADFTFATSSSPQQLEFVFDPATITLAEGGTGQFGMRLSGIPESDVTVSVARVTGDLDITVESGASLVFTPGDWYMPQMVTLAAAEDVDQEDGEAVIMVTSVSGPSVDTGTLVVAEVDNDSPEDPHGNEAAAVVSIYPIPFQPAYGTMTIDNLPSSGRIGIYDLRGQKVWDESWDGSNSLVWDGTSTNGSNVASGRYFVVISAADGQVTGKRVILVVN